MDMIKLKNYGELLLIVKVLVSGTPKVLRGIIKNWVSKMILTQLWTSLKLHQVY